MSSLLYHFTHQNSLKNKEAPVGWDINMVTNYCNFTNPTVYRTCAHWHADLGNNIREVKTKILTEVSNMIKNLFVGVAIVII